MIYLSVAFQGRFGNQCLQYLFARAWAEAHDVELRTDEWIGERVFDIQHARPLERHEKTRMSERQLLECVPENFVFGEFRGYAQHQDAMIYSKRQAQAWLTFRQDILFKVTSVPPLPVVAHLRRGDYFGYGYPVVSQASYRGACLAFGLQDPFWVSEENPTYADGLPNDLQFVVDFITLVRARTLLRANSTFSWLAALLGNGLVLSPVIDGLEGGKEHDCRFVAGNHPRFANLDFITDLYVNP